MTFFRTFDRELRESRRRLLAEAAARVAASVDGSEFEAMVSGSLSRGQTHPWSDLDVVLVKKDADASEDFELEMAARQAAGEVPADVMFERDVYEPLQRGILGSLVRPDEIPPLAELPDPDLALVRAAFSMETAIDQILESEAELETRPRDGDEKFENMLRRAKLSRAYRHLSQRMDLNLKRLAAFQDGGRSKWLDDSSNMRALAGLLGRLQEPATAPFPRPAVMTREAAEAVRWLQQDDLDPYWNPGKLEAMDARMKETVSAILDWTTLLRHVSKETETHGLETGAGMKP